MDDRPSIRWMYGADPSKGHMIPIPDMPSRLRLEEAFEAVAAYGVKNGMVDGVPSHALVSVRVNVTDPATGDSCG